MRMLLVQIGYVVVGLLHLLCIWVDHILFFGFQLFFCLIFLWLVMTMGLRRSYRLYQL